VQLGITPQLGLQAGWPMIAAGAGVEISALFGRQLALGARLLTTGRVGLGLLASSQHHLTGLEALARLEAAWGYGQFGAGMARGRATYDCVLCDPTTTAGSLVTTSLELGWYPGESAGPVLVGLGFVVRYDVQLALTVGFAARLVLRVPQRAWARGWGL